MADRLSIYILGDYRPGLPDGLAEFSYQNVSLLKDHFNFHFIEFRPFEQTDYFDEEEVDGVMIHVFGTLDVPSWRLSETFKDWLGQLSLDNILFHINHIYNVNNYLVARRLNRLGIRYLHTPHDSYVYGTKFKRSRPFYKRIYRELFVYFVDKYVLDHASLVHALTTQSIPHLQSVTKSPIMAVANQVHDMHIELDLGNIELQVCFIGRNDFRQKGIDRTIKGFHLFKTISKFANKARLQLIGPSNLTTARLRKNLVNDLELVEGKDIIFAGKIPETERNLILQKSKAYIHLSRFEGFGLSLIQALSASKPVIVSKEIAINDKILEYNAGFVVDSKSETAEALNTIFSFSPEQYLEMAHNARKCYELEFIPEVIRPQLIKLYETAAKSNT